MKILALLVGAIAIQCTSALAAGSPFGGFFSGNQVYDTCTGGNPATDTACMSYIAGVMDELVTFDEVMSKSIDPTMACVPTGVTVEQIKDLVVKFMRDNPKVRNNRASSIVSEVILTNYPCKK
jgi:hypothetical protein